jgi:putative ABC transport system ATP-binding protein
VLLLDAVSKAYGSPPRPILSNVSLQLQAGEYIAVMGESGVGKSTLLNLIAGLDMPDAGRIAVDGEDLAKLTDAARTRLRRAKMGFVFQAFHLLPHLTVERNIALPLALNGVADPVLKQRVDELLAAVGLDTRRSSLPRELSGGEMQRVAIARALAHRPRLVLADEPTGNLDVDSAAEILELLRAQLKRDNAAGILVTHSQTAADTTDAIYRLLPQGLQRAARQPA